MAGPGPANLLSMIQACSWSVEQGNAEIGPRWDLSRISLKQFGGIATAKTDLGQRQHSQTKWQLRCRLFDDPILIDHCSYSHRVPNSQLQNR